MLKNLLAWLKNLFTKTSPKTSERTYELKYLYKVDDNTFMGEIKILGLPEDTPKDKKYYWSWFNNGLMGPLSFKEIKTDGDTIYRHFYEGIMVSFDNGTPTARMEWQQGRTSEMTRIDPNDLSAELHDQIVNFVANKKTWIK